MLSPHNHLSAVKFGVARIGDLRAEPVGAGAIQLTTTAAGLDMYARAGLGVHRVILDIEAVLSELSETVTEVEAVIVSPTEVVSRYSAKPPFAATEGAKDPQLFKRDVTTALGAVSHRFIAVRHTFAERGEHRLALRFSLGNNGDWVSTMVAVFIDIGDGLFDGAGV